MDLEPEVDVLVVGAGITGIYQLYRAREAGFSVVLLEAGAGVGGTWYWNRYPGARCDVESVDYSYSFDEDLQNEWMWSERFAAQPEILAYLDHVAYRFDLRRYYRFETEVVGARFDPTGEWVVHTSAGGSHRGRFLLCATGCLSAVNRPDIKGFADFAGEVYYTAAWPREDPDLRGKKIGVIGTGSSGIQAGAHPRRRGGVVGRVSAIPELHGADAEPPVVGGGPAADPEGVSRAAQAVGLRARGYAARHASQERARYGCRRAAGGVVAALA